MKPHLFTRQKGALKYNKHITLTLYYNQSKGIPLIFF